MTADQFAYWLQGFAELNGGAPSDEQWQSIRDHLQTVFVKVTPEFRLPPMGAPNGPPWSNPNWTGCAPAVQPWTTTKISDGHAVTYC